MQTNKIATIHLIELLVQKGVRDFIISPGSRNAPIIKELVRRKDINIYSIADERSAAFVAIGMYQKTGNPVVITCTSGSALLNYAPGISEAFYQGIPLIVVSADRPSYWIDKGEGQTIRQRRSLSNFIHSELNIPLDSAISDYKALDKEICQCIDQSMEVNLGPVHINIEFEEPLYDDIEDFDNKAIVCYNEEVVQKDTKDFSKYIDRFSESKRIMLLCGQLNPDNELNKVLNELSNKDQLIVLTETTSNLYSDHFITSIDKTLFTIEKMQQEFTPDILITIGDAVISKMIKKFIRENPPMEHWQISEKGVFRDTYQALSSSIHESPYNFINSLCKANSNSSSDYASKWRDQFDKSKRIYNEFEKDLVFSDLKVFDYILNNLDENIDLHISNSSAVRYQQLFSNRRINTFCNRGTSGIDGCSSTAIGFSIKNKNETWLISGDVSFLYDASAWWNNYETRLKIILINNGGGGIFRILPGPKRIPQHETYFETRHNVKIDHLCNAYGLDHFFASDMKGLKVGLINLKKSNNRSLLEIKTPTEVNDLVLNDLFSRLRSEII